MNALKEEILEILSEDARIPNAKIAIMLGTDESTVENAIREMERDHIILKYTAQVNREKAGDEKVEALIEVRVTPQRDRGFDSIARRIYQFEEVNSVYLMSGGYDLMVLVCGVNMRQVALFVGEKLSTIEGVLSTATHFVLRKYKSDGVVMDDEEMDDRLVIQP
ncbi:MAG: Lrp/AsnC family transcriptional regulator [Christensenellales bacterium]|jgi:DNA-binding Lrp family transcriptional regulator